jgi:hypothetical protein
MRTHCSTSSSRPLAALATRSPEASSSSKMAAVSASRTSRTRIRSWSSRSSGARFARAASLTRRRRPSCSAVSGSLRRFADGTRHSPFGHFDARRNLGTVHRLGRFVPCIVRGETAKTRLPSAPWR